MRIRYTRGASLLLNNSYNSKLRVCSDCLQTSRATYFNSPTASSFYPARRRHQSSWAQAVSVATSVLSNATSRAANGGDVTIDPLKMVAKEMKFLTGNIR